MFKSSESRTLHFSPFKSHLFTEARLVWGFARPSEVPSGERERPKKAPEEKANDVSEREALRKEVESDRLLSELLKKKGKEVKAFIDLHGAAERDYKPGDWKQWNKDFLQALGLPVGDDEANQRRVWDLQVIIYKRADRSNVSKVDGKFGPSSLIALARYANVEVKAEKGVDPRVEILSEEDKGIYFQRYKEALSDELDDVVDELDLDDEMSALEGAPRDKFFSLISKVVAWHEGGSPTMDMTTVEGWREAFKNANLSKEDIRAMGLKAAPEKLKVRNDLMPSKEVVKLAGAELLKRIDDEINTLRESRRQTIQFFQEAKDAPDERLNLDDIKTEVIKKAYQSYEKAYDDWKKASEDHSNFKKQKQARDKALNELANVWVNYFDSNIVAFEKIKGIYQERAIKLAEKYDFKGLNAVSFTTVETEPKTLLSGMVDEFLIDSKACPTRAIATKEDFYPYLRGKNGEEKNDTWNEMNKVIRRLNEDALTVINQWIYSNNLIRFSPEHQNLLNDFNSRLSLAAEDVNAMTVDELKYTPKTGEIKPKAKEVDDKKESSNVNLANPEKLTDEVVLPFINGEAKDYLDAISRDKKEKMDWIDAIKERPDNAYVLRIITDVPSLLQVAEEYGDTLSKYQEASADKKGFDAELNAKNEAYGKMEAAFEAYYTKLSFISHKYDKIYKEKTLELIKKFDFPKDVPSEVFEHRFADFNWGMSGYMSSLSYKARKFAAGNFLRGDLKDYLSVQDPPQRMVKSEADLMDYVEGDTLNEKRENIKQMKKVSGKEDLVEAFNSWVYAENIARFTREHFELIEQIKKDRDNEVEGVKKLPLSELLK